MGPGHTFPNRENYLLDHRCPQHGEKAQPAVWGRHKDLELIVTIAQYEVLVAPVVPVQEVNAELLALCRRALEQSARVHPDFTDALRAAIAKADPS
jgi:hypothetical protein